MSHAIRAVRGYRSAQTQTSSPIELVVLLYDGALRFLAAAERGFADGDTPARAAAIDRTLAIVQQLQNTLDLSKGGAVAEELDRLYEFIQERLLTATQQQTPAPLADARKVLESLAEAWRTLAANSGAAASA